MTESKIPDHLAIAKTRQVRMRYTGDGTAAAAGHPADPEHPEFWAQLSDAEIERLEASGLYEHIGEYDADEDERRAAAEKEV